jgi:hypothetical protein
MNAGSHCIEIYAECRKIQILRKICDVFFAKWISESRQSSDYFLVVVDNSLEGPCSDFFTRNVFLYRE